MPLVRKLLVGVLVAFCSWYLISDYFFDEDNITHIVGRYYTATYDEGVALHWYEDVDKPYGKPLLDNVFATQLGHNYLIVRVGADVYFMFPIAATTIQMAQQGKIGPLQKSEMNNKLLQLYGDTLLNKTGPF